IPATTVQIPRAVVLQFNTHAYGGLIAIAHAPQGLRVNTVRADNSRFRVPRSRSRADPVPPRCRAPRRRRYGPTTAAAPRSEEHTSELRSIIRISYAVFC